MRFDFTTGYSDTVRKLGICTVNQRDPLTGRTNSVQMHEVYDEERFKQWLNMPPVTFELLDAVLATIPINQWSETNDRKLRQYMLPIVISSFKVAAHAGDPALHIASTAREIYYFVSSHSEDDNMELALFIGKLITVYLRAQGQNMPKVVRPELLKAIQRQEAGIIHRVIKSNLLGISPHAHGKYVGETKRQVISDAHETNESDYSNHITAQMAAHIATDITFNV
tara:strand:- start:845 stop:1519 length:675 start_codon:yes stop_codon:yes gene_type:complete